MPREEAYSLTVSTTRAREFAEVLGAAGARQIQGHAVGWRRGRFPSRPTPSRRPVRHGSETSLRPGLQVSGIAGHNQRRTRAAYRSYSTPNFTFRYCSSGTIAPQRSNPAETGTATSAQNDGHSSDPGVQRQQPEVERVAGYAG